MRCEYSMWVGESTLRETMGYSSTVTSRPGVLGGAVGWTATGVAVGGRAVGVSLGGTAVDVGAAIGAVGTTVDPAGFGWPRVPGRMERLTPGQAASRAAGQDCRRVLPLAVELALLVAHCDHGGERYGPRRER